MSSSCHICGNVIASACGGCGNVSYCGRDCQRKDWKNHKNQCKCYKITKDQSLHGNHVIAARDVRAGEIIMTSACLVSGPRLQHPRSLCVGCHTCHDQDDLSRCSQCRLPVCGSACQQSQIHQQECGLISSSDVDVPVSAVTPLRVIKLKFTNPEAYKTIMELEDNLVELKQKNMWPYYEQNVIDPIVKLNLPDVTDEDIHRIVGIILTNSFETSGGGQSVQSSSIIGVFSEPSMMNHHCVANTRIVLHSGNVLKVIAAVPITKGAPIYNNYARAIDTTWTRRLNLEQNKCFVCDCERCSDPGELGANTSGLVCPGQACDGTLLPMDTMNMSTSWQCGLCNQVQSSTQARAIIKSLEDEAANFQKDDISSLKMLLRKYGTKLHRNHTLMIELKQLLVSGMGRMPGYLMEEMSYSDMRLKMMLCTQLLEVLDIVSPGLSLGRGLILFELHSVLVTTANMEYASTQDRRSLAMKLTEAASLLKEAVKILSYESPDSEYGHLISASRDSEEQLAGYIQSVSLM